MAKEILTNPEVVVLMRKLCDDFAEGKPLTKGGLAFLVQQLNYDKNYSNAEA